MNRSSDNTTGRQATGEVNGFAIASLVLGIVWLMGIGAILALVFGYVARSQIADARGAQSGGGLATAGIVLGWVGVSLVLAAGVLMAFGWLAWPTMPMMR